MRYSHGCYFFISATISHHKSHAFQLLRHQTPFRRSYSILNHLHSNNRVMWDPETQTYADGVVPSHHTALDIEELLLCNEGNLKIFGYGSLCWHPGSDGVLSLANNKHSESQVTAVSGRAIGYQRCWSQRSADHRGTTEFNGIVCTLLSDEEVRSLHHDNNVMHRPSLTEGVIYTVHKELVEDCLAELDFREKGGYARDVIDVIEDNTGKTVKALLYRGTPDNPAFWKRAYLDLSYAAAIMSVAIGPSGRNDAYLRHLHEFLSGTAQQSRDVAEALKYHAKDDRTGELVNMVNLLQTEYRPYFLFGTGSNEHYQLLLSANYKGNCSRISEVNELTEMLLTVPRSEQTSTNDNDHAPKKLIAGGGHSALLTDVGDMYLWGWNDSGQLGRPISPIDNDSSTLLLNPIHPLDIKVETADLGHTHTLVIEKDTGRLFGFGDNGRGQVTGQTKMTNDSCHVPHIPICLADERFVDVAAGLFHSAAITDHGELMTWGCSRFGQSFVSKDSLEQQQSCDVFPAIEKWSPPDGSKLVQVACGRRHTIVLDEHGRVWSMGDNKYGQLGRSVNGSSAEPMLVDGPLGQMKSGCLVICSGWSHVLGLARHSGTAVLYGWGRNDKGQLGLSFTSKDRISTPQVVPISCTGGASIQSICCGAESSHVLDESGRIYCTGWNEHGNLGIGCSDNENNVSQWKEVSSVNVVSSSARKSKRKLFAAGGAHLIVAA